MQGSSRKYYICLALCFFLWNRELLLMLSPRYDNTNPEYCQGVWTCLLMLCDLVKVGGNSTASLIVVVVVVVDVHIERFPLLHAFIRVHK